MIELAGKVIERAGSSSKIKLVPYEDAYGPGFEELGRRIPDISAIAGPDRVAAVADRSTRRSTT